MFRRPRRGALGLRGRIVGAVVVTTCATLAVAALALLGPLEQSLRSAALKTLQQNMRYGTIKQFKRLDLRHTFSTRVESGSTTRRRARGRAELAKLIATRAEHRQQDRRADHDVRLLRRAGPGGAAERRRRSGLIPRRPAGVPHQPDGVELRHRRRHASTPRMAIPTRRSWPAVRDRRPPADRRDPGARPRGPHRLHRRRAGRTGADALAGHPARRHAGAPPAPPARGRAPARPGRTGRSSRSTTSRDEVGDLGRAFSTMQRRLAQQEEARRAFVATASHELRTPLTSLEGMLELLQEDLYAARRIWPTPACCSGARGPSRAGSGGWPPTCST